MRGLLGARNDVDRNSRGLRIVPQQVEQHEAVDVADSPRSSVIALGRILRTIARCPTRPRKSPP